MIRKTTLIISSIFISQANCTEKQETHEERRARVLPIQIENQRKDKEFAEWDAAESEKIHKLTQEDRDRRMQTHLMHMELIKSEPLEKRVERFRELSPLMIGIGGSSQDERTIKERLELKPLKLYPLAEGQAIDRQYISQCQIDWRILYPKCHPIVCPPKNYGYPKQGRRGVKK